MQCDRTFDIEIIALKAHQDPIVVPVAKKIKLSKTHVTPHRKYQICIFYFLLLVLRL